MYLCIPPHMYLNVLLIIIIYLNYKLILIPIHVRRKERRKLRSWPQFVLETLGFASGLENKTTIKTF